MQIFNLFAKSHAFFVFSRRALDFNFDRNIKYDFVQLAW